MQYKLQDLKKFEINLPSHTSFFDGLSYISKTAKDIVKSDRCSLFIYDIEANELWTTLADGVEKIVIPFDMVIVGLTMRLKKPIIENDPYGNSNFMSDVDMRTGYYTQNILAVPIFNKQKEIIGVLQLLNKDGDFTKEDLEVMILFCEAVSKFITTSELL